MPYVVGQCRVFQIWLSLFENITLSAKTRVDKLVFLESPEQLVKKHLEYYILDQSYGENVVLFGSSSAFKNLPFKCAISKPALWTSGAVVLPTPASSARSTSQRPNCKRTCPAWSQISRVWQGDGTVARVQTRAALVLSIGRFSS